MTQLGQAGVNINFTYDEISPLLGVDPFDMYKAIRSIGVEHVTLVERLRRAAVPQLGGSAAPDARLHGSVRIE